MEVMGQGPNYFGALAELAKDVGATAAQVNERVTYKELMAQNTEQRREINMRMDKVESHLSDVLQNSANTIGARMSNLDARLDALGQRLESLAQMAANNSSRGNGSGKIVLGSITTTIGAAIGVGGYLLLRSFGVAF